MYEGRAVQSAPYRNAEPFGKNARHFFGRKAFVRERRNSAVIGGKVRGVFGQVCKRGIKRGRQFKQDIRARIPLGF